MFKHITKLVEMVQANKDHVTMERRCIVCMLKQYLWQYLKHVHRHRCDIWVGKMLALVMITISPDDSLTMAMHGSNSNIAQHIMHMLIKYIP